MKRILYFLLGLAGLLAILCSIACASVTNESLYLEGFQKFANASHLGVSFQQYGDYAHALSQYLQGKADVIQVENPETGEMENAFSEKENERLKAGRGLVGLLKIIRYAGGGLVIAILAALYFLRKDQRPQLLSDAARGFAAASMALLAIALTLLVWGLADFGSLFRAFHRAFFANDPWLTGQENSQLASLMPESFFSWYAVQALKSLGPVLAMMLLIIIAWLRMEKTQKEPKTK